MTATVQVAIHSSQFPEAVRGDLLDSLRQGTINHKFHYDSIKQAQKWLALHNACSPARTRPEVAATYHRAFEQTARIVCPGTVHVIGLGCGGGAKDCALLSRLQGSALSYTPIDVSTALVLTSWQAARLIIPPDRCFPLVCDLAKADDLPSILDAQPNPRATRLVTFFGMLPNLEPETILPRLAALVRPGDLLLCSANLAPGTSYQEGVARVLPLYDNTLTREWLLMFLSDLGVDPHDGTTTFGIEEHPPGSRLLRIAASFQFVRHKEFRIDSHTFTFRPTDVLRLFFSYRHTPELVEGLLAAHGLPVSAQWISPCGEEGLFLARRLQPGFPAPPVHL